MAILGVNIDHVATLREARKTHEPDPVWAAAMAELGGADGITLHLREDRRHIQERDLRVLMETTTVPLNLELATDPEVLKLACDVGPHQVTLVPENREEVTTEGGLDVVGQQSKVQSAVQQLHEAGVKVSLFLDPEPVQIDAAGPLRVDGIELHTGPYALAQREQQVHELTRLAHAGRQIRDHKIALHAGHGLNYQNVRAVASLEGMQELNIGHSIVARAVLVGMQRAVRDETHSSPRDAAMRC